MQTLWQDLRYGVRMLTKQPGFTAAAVLSLALGVSVNTAVFTLLYSLAWRPLPAPGSASIVNISARKLQPARFGALFSSALSLLALVMVTVGIYGVMAFLVSHRTREIGIRKALGAQTSDLLKLVIWQGMALVVVGLVIGLALSLALTRFIAGQLYGVSATDPATFAAITLLLTTVAMLACWIPARRAAKVDPMIALRCE